MILQKGWHRYGGFALSDSDGNYVLPGLREMSTKSAQDILCTFKDILQYITESLEYSENDTSLEILRNIQNTMSNRSSNELNSKTIVKIYSQLSLKSLNNSMTKLEHDWEIK